ncbi:copper amine oxidase [Sodiomyces alkalinus F11]|uniref:Amine oxidase n=1 Tax=Sodiomyces alkalinus (strain CBS 110278 / VKM F-3762 / F11) TaxID=1314773 RepID=A0A3N2PIU5_SODAK|nr:copper amine oxidase [Sodiomyces alkalinus F11]ROT34472.1 copper amine oxidase [Sodiomyces alkalinus F11]
MAVPHPLAPLSKAEFERARDTVVKLYGPDSSLFFRSIYLHEPPRADLVSFLQAEHDGTLTDSTPRPLRLAVAHYDVIHTATKHLEYAQSVVDLNLSWEIERRVAGPRDQAGYPPFEFAIFYDACVKSSLFKEAMAEFVLPEHFTVTIDPWPYGGLDPDDDRPRLLQGLVYARDGSNNNPDSNHYGFPIPIIPVMDVATKEIIRVDRLATGGAAQDGLEPAPRESDAKPKPLFLNSRPSEYVPELLDRPLRTDMKPINITQPEGTSFTVHPDNLVEWQKWRFRLGFTPREGAVLHDLCYDNRPILLRVSYSELTVPYGDPRPPFQRKQAFDLGDGGFGRAANNLELGCDCLGAIHYFDAYLTDPRGNPTLAKSVVCLHEQDNGIGWKHTNFRTDRAVVTRLRELVVQCVVTLANYEYIFAYKLDVAGGITLETRATGIVSVVAIDEGKRSPYGNVVAPGVLAQNHQHIFAVRIDPAVDSYAAGDSRVAVEESVPVAADPETNPYGNYYEVRKRTVEKACWLDAEPMLNRLVRLENARKKNEVSGRPVGYKLTPPPTQLLLADRNGLQGRRAKFAHHHVWVTGHRDGELWAAGEFTNQSTEEKGGVYDMVQRGDWFVDDEEGEQRVNKDDEDEDGGKNAEEQGRLSSPILWSVFGLTHNPRVEDWPVMPVEVHHVNIRPADFFTSNPALDVPSFKNKASVIVPCCGGRQDLKAANANSEAEEGTVQRDAAAHMQGPGPDLAAGDVGAHVK